MGDKTASEKKAEAIAEMIAEQPKSEVKEVAAPTKKGKKAKAEKPK